LEDHGFQPCGFLLMNRSPEIDLPLVVPTENESVPVAAITFGAQALSMLLKRY
jgi:hypothetical protein